MNEKKICPLLSMIGIDPAGSPCVENHCAWWDGGQCALCGIAENTGDLAENIYDIKSLSVRLEN